MYDIGVIGLIAGLLQLVVAGYALRLNRLFGSERVGWSLFSAFALLALLHLVESTGLLGAGNSIKVEVEVVYSLISLLLVVGLAHLEAVLKERARVERAEQLMRSELETRVKERTADLIGANEELRREIDERKRMETVVEKAQHELVVVSRQAGMAEVATSVLHNVGNVLNSVNVSASLLADQLKQSKAASIARVAALMREHAADLGDFMSRDPRGRQLPGYLTQLAEHLSTEHSALLEEIESLKENVGHIKEIVAMQQSYATVLGVTETVKVVDLVEDALRMNAGALARHDIELIREYAPRLPEVTLEKHKVLQILINLIRNAKYACDESGHKEKRLTMRVTNHDDRIKVSVIDNGVGISPENLKRVFNYGFTTKKDGHGFGLHSGALAAREMGGVLIALSDGPGAGATFTLELPVRPKERLSGEYSQPVSQGVTAN